MSEENTHSVPQLSQDQINLLLVQNFQKQSETLQQLTDQIAKIAKGSRTEEDQQLAVDKAQKLADKALQESTKLLSSFKNHKPGDVAHTHEKQDADFTKIDVPCSYVSYKVKNRAGLKINGVVFSGTVTVPQCTADYMATMDKEREVNERVLHTNKGRLGREIGAFNG